jgi:hypothetical protein
MKYSSYNLFNPYIRPTVTYAFETWPVYECDKNRLCMLEKADLKKDI